MRRDPPLGRFDIFPVRARRPSTLSMLGTGASAVRTRVSGSVVHFGVAMADQEQIDRLMDHWAESRGSGQETATERLCAGYPHLRPEVERRIRAVQAIDALR